MDPLSFIENKPETEYDNEGKKVIKSIESQTFNRCPDCNAKIEFCDKIITWLSSDHTTTEYTFYCRVCEQNTFVDVDEGIDEVDNFGWYLSVKVYTQRSLGKCKN